MGLAEMVDAPVLLAGDIDRGGVFAQLLGTLMLLTREERARVKGLLINKFRGDPSILAQGITMLEERVRIPVTGVIPYMDLALEDEDSLTERFAKRDRGLLDLAVIRYPRISNFTDFNVFEQLPSVTVRYVTSVRELGRPDMVFLPGSKKNTMADLRWMRQNGLEAAVRRLAQEIPVFGICGGYQMLGRQISDPDQAEEGGSMRGMELLPVVTVLQKEKIRCQREGVLPKMEGMFEHLSGCRFSGYEIHMGKTFSADGQRCLEEPVLFQSVGDGQICGSYVHGLFDRKEIADGILQALAKRKGIRLTGGVTEDYGTFKERQYDKLADTLRLYLNMEEIYGMLRDAHLDGV